MTHVIDAHLHLLPVCAPQLSNIGRVHRYDRKPRKGFIFERYGTYDHPSNKNYRFKVKQYDLDYDKLYYSKQRNHSYNYNKKGEYETSLKWGAYVVSVRRKSLYHIQSDLKTASNDLNNV